MRERTQFGIILLLFGVGFILQQLDIISFTSLLKEWWPVVFVIVGLLELFKEKGKGLVSGSVFIVIGLILLLNQQYDLNIWQFIWPVLLIGLGLIFIFSKSNFNRDGVHNNESDLNLLAIFSESNMRSESRNFQAGKATVVFGSGQVDLREATLSERVDIEATAIFGEVEIYVPNNIRVVYKGVPIFGSFDDKTRKNNVENVETTIHVNAIVVFGSIVVKD